MLREQHAKLALLLDRGVTVHIWALCITCLFSFCGMVMTGALVANPFRGMCACVGFVILDVYLIAWFAPSFLFCTLSLHADASALLKNAGAKAAADEAAREEMLVVDDSRSASPVTVEETCEVSRRTAPPSPPPPIEREL